MNVLATVWLLAIKLLGNGFASLLLIRKGNEMKFIKTMAAIAVMISSAQLAAGQSPATVGKTPVAGNRSPAEIAKEQQQRDQLRIGVQEICPVSGEKLGSMGAPIKVKVGEENIFMCCKGCLKQKIKPEHWGTIHANFAKAQGICPVMKHELPKKPKWTIVEGQIVYVCCPPCTKKINADPVTYLRAVDQLYAASLEAKKKVR